MSNRSPVPDVDQTIVRDISRGVERISFMVETHVDMTSFAKVSQLRRLLLKARPGKLAKAELAKVRAQAYALVSEAAGSNLGTGLGRAVICASFGLPVVYGPEQRGSRSRKRPASKTRQRR